MLQILEGDLLQSDVQVIIHQCNCFHTFGGGIAKKIKQKYPTAFEADLKTKFGDKDKLGTFSYSTQNGKTIVNLYSQYRYGMDKVYTDYQSLEQGLYDVFYWCKLNKLNKIGIPYLIGCGLAGGDEKIVMKICERISKQFGDIKLRIYRLEKQK